MALMTSMRNRMHVVLWALLVLFLLSMTVGGLVGGANILDKLLGKVDPRTSIGMVNGENISPDTFSQLVSNQLESFRQSGEEITDLDLARIRDKVWESLVQDALIRQAVKDWGIEVTDDEVLYHLKNNPPPFLQQNPAFLTNGVFDMEKYTQAVNNPQGNEWAPVEQFMRNTYLPSYKLQQLILQSVTVSEADVRDEYMKRNVNFTINSIHVSSRYFDSDSLKPTDEAIQAEYNLRRDDFYRDERRVLKLVTWEKKATTQDTNDILAEAADLIAQLKNGADFAKLADEYSEDPGNQVSPDSGRGGYLGWFGRGQMVPAFEEAAFGGNPGDIVGPVLSNFGYHIIKIHNRKTEDNEEKVEASHILLRIEVSPRTKDQLRNAANLFSYDAQDYGFDAAVDTHQVQPRESMPFTEDAVSIGGLGPMRAAVRFAFNNEPGIVSDPFENDQFYAVVTLDSIIAPGPRPLEEVKPTLIRTLSDQIVHEKALQVIQALRAEIDQGKTFREVAGENKKLEVSFGDSKNLTQGFRNVGRSDMLIGALLNAKPGDVIGPVRTIRGYALVEVVKVPQVDEKDYEAQKPTIRKRLLASRQNKTYSDWLEAQQKAAEIIDNRTFYY
ncbi:MAG: hypothetical protein GXO90_00500 [FCB group bacterium]|nr:hypothetical protein [FCB group bacterium]